MNHVLRRTSIVLALAAALHGAAASATDPTPGLPTLYVSASGGSDANPGTAQAPKATINGALAAVTTTPAQVFVSDSLYSESVVLRSGVSLFGRFDPATWTRDPARVTTIQSAAEVFAGGSLDQPLAIDGFVLRSGSPASAGASSYVARLGSGSAPVTFTRNRFVIASASAGAPGFAGTAGDNGGNGNPGIAGQANSSGGGQGGGGGTSAASRAGGSGGLGGFDSGNGANGGTGSIGTTGGTGGTGNPCFSATADNVGGAGQNGSNGANGAAGPASAALGSFAASYIAPVGGNGTDGADGNGGGGGGGGGGGDNNNGICNSDRGGGGGGGGGGGQGGQGGTGGRGGGGAFGIYTSGVPVIVDRNRFDFQAAGGGPRGGVGGNGGNGGARGLGGLPGLAGAGADDAAPGGRGGEGGDGGFGGPGAGGAGGPAIAVAAPAGNLLTLGNNRHDLPPPAAGGLGGASGGGAQAPAGPLGVVERAHPVAVNEPPAPVLSIANVSIDRDPAGGTIPVPVPLNAATDAAIGATYTIVAGTATAADIVLGSGTMTLAPWDTQGRVPVTVLPSAPATPARSFTVQLSSPSGATLGTTSAVVTLAPPLLFANGFEPAPPAR